MVLAGAFLRSVHIVATAQSITKSASQCWFLLIFQLRNQVSFRPLPKALPISTSQTTQTVRDHQESACATREFSGRTSRSDRTPLRANRDSDDEGARGIARQIAQASEK